MINYFYDIIKENKELFELFLTVGKDGVSIIVSDEEAENWSSESFWLGLKYDDRQRPASVFDTFYDSNDRAEFYRVMKLAHPGTHITSDLFLRDFTGKKVANNYTIFQNYDGESKRSVFILFHHFRNLEKSEFPIPDSDLRYKIYFERSSVPMILFDLKEGEIVETNAAVENNCGFSIRKYPELKIWDMIKFENEGDKSGLILHLEKGEKFKSLNIRFFCFRRGGFFPALLDCVSSSEEEGNVLVWATLREQQGFIWSESDLKVNFEQLKSIVSMFPDLVIFLDANGFINNYYVIDVNKFFLPEIQVKSNRIGQIYGEETGDKFLKSIQSVLSKGGTDNFEYYILTVGGPEWFETRFLKGAAEEVIAIIRNITKQKSIENSLMEERKLLRTIIDHIPMNIYVKYLHLKKIMANKAEYEFLGADNEEEVLRLEDNNFFPAEIASDYRTEDELVLANGKPVIGKESKIKKINGEDNWFVTSKIPLLNNAGQLKGVVGISYDITEKKKSENELQAVKEQYELAIDGSNDGIWDWRISDKKIFYSARWKKQLGYDADELENNLETFWDKIHPADIEPFRKTLREYKDKISTHFQTEIRLRHKDSIYRWILSRAIGVWNEKGELIRLVGSHTDITQRINAQKELSKAKDFLAQTSLIAKVGGWETDYETEEVVWTDVTKKILGMPPEYVPVFGDGLRFFKEGIHRDLISGKLIKTLNTGEPFDMETILVNSNGEEKWVRLIGRIDLTVENSKKLVGTIQDIDELKKLEEVIQAKNSELEESYRLIREITDFISDVLWSYRINKEKVLMKVSITKQSDELLELPPGTIGDSFERFVSYVHKDDLPLLDYELQSLFIGRKVSCEIEYRMVLPSGDIKWVNTNAKAYEEESGGVYVVGRTTDINMRKKADQYIARQSELLKILISITSEFINLPLSQVKQAIDKSLEKLGEFISADIAYIYAYSNDNLPPQKLFSWSNDEYTEIENNTDDIIAVVDAIWSDKLKCGNYFNSNDLSKLDRESASCLERFKIKTIISFPLMDGTDCNGFIGFQFYSEFHDFSDFEIQLLKVFSESLVNIRKRANLQKHLINTKDEAEAANKAKSEFLANMSHEIRTPLNGVIGFSDLLMNSKLNEEQLQFARSANTSAHSLLGLINDILDFTKIEAGKMELEEIKTDIIELVEQTADIVKFSSAQKGVEFLLNIGLNVPRYIFTDSYRLKQILINLLSNAIKFTNIGEVELSLDFQGDTNHRSGKFTFNVRDTGIGISPEQQEKLFKSFSQADASTTRKFGGTGLGLAIAEMLVNKMGSSITIESRLDEGSVFSFSLEKNYEDGLKVNSIGIEVIKKVLIVDDNVTNSKILERILRHWGISSMAAKSGREALDLLKVNNEFHLLIIDYHMPEMDGLEAIRKIVDYFSEQNKERPKIILYSSADDSLVNSKSTELPIDYKLIKPAKTSELLYALNSIYNRDELITGTDKDRDTDTPDIYEFKNKVKILIAEDVPLNMLLVKTYINNNFTNFEIIEAEDGIAAVAQYIKCKPDLVLMDLQMPHRDGFEATRQIREIEGEASRYTVIVALTAGALQEEKIKCFQAGMNDFLTKPIHKDELISILKLYLKDK